MLTEVEKAVKGYTKEAQVGRPLNLRAVHPDGELLRVLAPLGENQRLGLLPRDLHLSPAGPLGHGVGRPLGSFPREFHAAACTQGRRVVCVDED